MPVSTPVVAPERWDLHHGNSVLHVPLELVFSPAAIIRSYNDRSGSNGMAISPWGGSLPACRATEDTSGKSGYYRVIRYEAL